MVSRLGLFVVAWAGIFGPSLVVAQDKVVAEDKVVAAEKKPEVPSASVLIDDKAGLFKPDTVEQARDKIRRIQELYDFGVFIETLEELPRDDLKKINAAKNPGRAFQQWAEERARLAEVDGVYVVLSKDPKHHNSAVVVSPESQKEFFSARDVDNLRKRFASRQFTRQPNQVLLETLDGVNDTLHSNRESPRSVSWSLIVTILLVCIGVWVAFGAIRALRNGSRDAQEAQSRGELHAKQKMMPALLGGMFGNIAGHWIYDTIFRAGSDKSGPHGDPFADHIEIKEDRKG